MYKSLLLAAILLLSLSCNVHQQNHPSIVLFYFPGFGGRDYEEFVSGNQALFDNRHIEVVNMYHEGLDPLYLRTSTIDSLTDVIEKHISDKNPDIIYMGGFSMGGYGCARVFDRLTNKGINISGVFIVDAPLNFGRFYHSLQSQTTATIEVTANESKYLTDIINREIPTISDSALAALTPGIGQPNPSKALAASKWAFYYSDSYAWQLKNRQRDSTDLHIADIKAIYKEHKTDSNTMFYFQHQNEDDANNPHSIRLFDAAKYFDFVE